MYYPCSENKDADQLRGTAKLICVFVFAHANCWFSHAQAHFSLRVQWCLNRLSGRHTLHHENMCLFAGVYTGKRIQLKFLVLV